MNSQLNQSTCVIDEYGNKIWYLNGHLHREDGPAIENANGDKSWYINGKLHREDGLAVECIDGYKLWYLNNTFLGGVKRT
jgi:hypothetical protein